MTNRVTLRNEIAMICKQLNDRGDEYHFFIADEILEIPEIAEALAPKLYGTSLVQAAQVSMAETHERLRLALDKMVPTDRVDEIMSDLASHSIAYGRVYTDGGRVIHERIAPEDITPPLCGL